MSKIISEVFNNFASSMLVEGEKIPASSFGKNVKVVIENKITDGVFMGGKFYYNDKSGKLCVVLENQVSVYEGDDSYRPEAIKAALNMYKNISSRDGSGGDRKKALEMACKAFSIPESVIQGKLQEEASGSIQEGFEGVSDEDLEVEEGYRVLPNIDRERYTDIEGLEGPFMLHSGKVVYYDPHEGKYYDRDIDMYLSDEEYFSHANPKMESMYEELKNKLEKKDK